MTELSTFDVADYLDDEEVIAEYLAASLEDENPKVFIRALADVAKARGMSEVAEAAGLGRQSLYKALAGDVQPRHDTIRRVIDALGMRLTVTPKADTHKTATDAVDAD
jgi:probable addiction module antidote protein